MRTSVIVLISLAFVTVVGLIFYFINKSNQNILNVIDSKPDNNNVEKIVAQDPTAIDWINAIKGTLSESGFFDWTKALFNKK